MRKMNALANRLVGAFATVPKYELAQMTICLPEAKATVSLDISTGSCLCVLSSFGELNFSSLQSSRLRRELVFRLFLEFILL